MKDNIDLLEGMIDFCEESWAAFVFRMSERGFTEEEIEEAFEKLKNDIRS